MTERSPRQWFLYVLRCGDGTLYAGITIDIERRLRLHSAGKGARYTRGRGPLTLLRCWPCAEEGAARRAEARFKRLSRLAKLQAIARELPP
ncbi:MAG: GIY-YIG nuclease family protein [Dehalococcoidia bacterium]